MPEYTGGERTRAEAAEALVREVLRTGVSVRGRILRARPPAHHGHGRLYGLAAFRLLDRDGAVLGVSITVVDVTDRERAMRRLRIPDTVPSRPAPGATARCACRPAHVPSGTAARHWSCG
ncbi:MULTISPECIES: PAS domain-containing protein [unclassified Streptomyces]|uniref:PAS domain-containing protein n=1 Tax=unclassified Streptomyces TaxID=2593676 RepID=UPI0040425BA6